MAGTDPDPSNGYEALAKDSTWSRSRSSIGVATVREWAKALPQGAAVLDLGCGTGVPISQALLDEGLSVYGVDASPSMIAEFRRRFPDAPAECRAVEDSDFFGREFDGVVAWGLMFLLRLDVQEKLITKVSRVLKSRGKFLFTSASQCGEWSDILTGREARSPGAQEYRRMVAASGLILQNEAEDEGGNFYYFSYKP
ncbi:MAG TPA: class I SAM-dependent methyltransferase [Gemmatimonadales bacterium]|nr:class I SAM-dependent methyltransferase [Gemmatimonadales bacterium]